ncbi:MAG: VWA domain-containing protein [Candidatus Krumholzibacteria bacterium]|nr:VWA domain-containing protein [Candidatus Krumholzibacteria bacterium]
MKFAQEIWLWLVPLLPVLWLLLRSADRKAAGRMRILLGEHAGRHVEGANPRLRSWRRFLWFAGLFWLLLALARPQWGASEVTVTQRGSDIVVALDISNSMLAKDVPPNRMERAKTELGSFLGRLEDSRIGLVFFAGAAFVQCPLTLDYGTAEIFLKMAGPDMMSEQGTAIASALKTGRELLAKGREGAGGGTFQAILLVTDGEDLEGDWEKEAEACQKDGIRVIPVGVGEESGGLIPTQDTRGRAAGFMKDEDGKVVMTRLDMASLGKLALIGGGSPFRLGVDGLAGDRLFAELKRLGRRDLEERRVSAYQERFILPLILSLLCFAVRMLLRPRGMGTSRSPGRPGIRMLVALGLLLGLAATDGAVAGSILPVKDDLVRGREKYLAGEFDEALRDFESALVQDPEDPMVTLAVGETLFRLERYEEALAEFERTLSLTDDKELKAEALYNSGTTLLAAGDPGKAAEKLLDSLAVDDSQGDALYNLEVALRRLQEQQQQEEQEEQEQDDQEKDQQDQEQKDQEQQEQKDQEKQEQQEQQEQSDQPENQQEPTEPDPEELTQEQALQILKALDRDEEELKRSVQKRLKGGKPKSGKKW